VREEHLHEVSTGGTPAYNNSSSNVAESYIVSSLH
jgi:phage head maturation protease